MQHTHTALFTKYSLTADIKVKEKSNTVLNWY